MPSEVDIAIIGAGASGLAAAHALADAPVTVQVLEARDRIGGRAHTLHAGPFPLDLGCGWLHSAEHNPFAKLAADLAFPLDKTPPHWMRQAGNADFTAADQAAFRDALHQLDEKVGEVAESGRDVAISTIMDPAGRWTPLLNAFSAYYNGAEFDQISTVDYHAYEDSGTNWRTPLGYGALIAAFGAAAPVSLETPVTRIDHSGPRVRIENARGTISARAVIVTLPTPLIAYGAVRFSPDLETIREAAAALPLGLADKVYLALDEPEAFEPESHLFGDPTRTATGSYHLRPYHRPIIEAYLGGRHAHDLEAAGPGASEAFAIDELVRLLGSSFRSKIRPIVSTRWAHDPWARGSYSHATPGGAWARAALAEPVDDRLFFAGEAASPHAFSTAHGAAQAGDVAARRALQALGVNLPELG